MAAAGFTTIQLYRTTTAAAVPVNTNLAEGELAINTLDERLYFKNSAGTVKLLAANITPIANGGTGQTTANAAFNALVPSQTSNSGRFLTTDGTNTSWAVFSAAGSNTQIQFNNSGAFGGSSNLTWSGTVLTITGSRFGADSTRLTNFVGSGALASNTTGSSNNAFGNNSLNANTTGANNNAFGNNSLNANTTGTRNNAFGQFSLNVNVAGTDNSAFGQSTLSLATSGSFNSAFGSLSCFAVGGSYNSAFGHRALLTGSGSYNTAIGFDTFSAMTSGSGNVGIGTSNSSGTYLPPFDVTTQNDRIVIGSTSSTNAYIQIAWTVVSDLRDKVVFGGVPHGLEFVKKLKPITYKFKESRDSDQTVGTTKYGFGAQDILALEGDAPVIVDIEQPEKLKLTDQHLLPIFSNAISELAEQVEQLKAEIAALKAK
jgi:hypothetical protein